MEYTAENIMSWSRLGMRKAFGGVLLDVAREHDDLIVLAADVASSAKLTGFAQELPKSFYNIGIAEQNMTGIAAGLAKEGHNVFIVSFAPFVSMRAFEAIRTLVGYMHLNIKVVALASGLSLGPQGNTHYCMEDIALMRTIPGMQVLCPADCVEMAKCVEFLADYQGPAYLRLTGIDGSPNIYKGDYAYQAGKATELREGADVAVIGTGSILNECVRVSRAIKRDGISCAVFDMHTIKPLDTALLEQICRQYKLIVTAEEHNVLGGLGGAVAEFLAKQNSHPPLLTIGIEDQFPHAGTYSYLMQQCGLTAQQIKDRIVERWHALN